MRIASLDSFTFLALVAFAEHFLGTRASTPLLHLPFATEACPVSKHMSGG